MDRSFLEQIQETFADFVREHEFRVLMESYSPTDFGNAVAVLEGEEYSIRVVRDRFQVFVDIASHADPGNWHSLERVLAALDAAEEASGSFALADAVERIRENHGRLAEHLSPQRYPIIKRELDRRGEAAKQRLLNRLQPGG